jgi:hypothetical protein
MGINLGFSGEDGEYLHEKFMGLMDELGYSLLVEPCPGRHCVPRFLPRYGTMIEPDQHRHYDYQPVVV